MLKGQKKIKVLIVDDSESVQNMLSEFFEKEEQIELIGTASDPYIAAAKIAREVPDVITLDIEMPRMNGLTFLRKLMRQHPIPVIIISSLTSSHSDLSSTALELGASEIITKPCLNNQQDIEEYRARVCHAVLVAAISHNNKYGLQKKPEPSVDLYTKPEKKSTDNCEKIILIGASTGGTELISEILKCLSINLPPIVVVQHMPGEFTTSFAKRLDMESGLVVKEAEQGDILQNGHVYIANGFFHLVVKEKSNCYVCELNGEDLVNRHRPSVDVLFSSLAKSNAQNVMGILLTGMGKDGAKGLLELKKKGATCIAQDEDSSVVFGMPKEAIKIDAVNFIGRPQQIISWINNFA